ncbi:MAG: hypothetical protein H6Q23_2313, partial [Bacteroidetes bacterium]|nr:hypothetical protein [Bacteroidota bacterium]
FAHFASFLPSEAIAKEGLAYFAVNFFILSKTPLGSISAANTSNIKKLSNLKSPIL